MQKSLWRQWATIHLFRLTKLKHRMTNSTWDSATATGLNV